MTRSQAGITKLEPAATNAVRRRTTVESWNCWGSAELRLHLDFRSVTGQFALGYKHEEANPQRLTWRSCEGLRPGPRTQDQKRRDLKLEAPSQVKTQEARSRTGLFGL